MSSTLETIPGGCSDESLNSISTAIQCVKTLVASQQTTAPLLLKEPQIPGNRRSGYVSEGESLAFPDSGKHQPQPSCDIGMFAKKMRSNFDVYQHGIRNLKVECNDRLVVNFTFLF